MLVAWLRHPMISEALQSALNEQINREFQASYLYLSMSAEMDTAGFAGFAKWLRLQSTEETTHGMKLYDYVLARQGAVELGAIPKPPAKFGSPLQVAQSVLDHEREVTKLINKLYATAAKEGDYVTAAELQWFLTEQVEEEKVASDIVQRLTIAGQDANALLLIDRELMQRAPE